MNINEQVQNVIPWHSPEGWAGTCTLTSSVSGKPRIRRLLCSVRPVCLYPASSGLWKYTNNIYLILVQFYHWNPFTQRNITQCNSGLYPQTSTYSPSHHSLFQMNYNFLSMIWARDTHTFPRCQEPWYPGPLVPDPLSLLPAHKLTCSQESWFPAPLVPDPLLLSSPSSAASGSRRSRKWSWIPCNLIRPVLCLPSTPTKEREAVVCKTSDLLVLVHSERNQYYLHWTKAIDNEWVVPKFKCTFTYTGGIIILILVLGISHRA